MIVMKKVLSISLGSSKRNHRVETEILGQDFIIERRGTDGDKKKARRLFVELDGQYDAFGLGGIDLNIYCRGRHYTFRDALKLIRDVKITPVVDGSGLKNTLERRVINYLHHELGLNFNQKKVLMVSAVDRFGMAESFVSLNADIIIGDLIFGLGIPIPIYSIETLDWVARFVAPIITKFPFEWIYPTGNKQDNHSSDNKKYASYYQKADIIAGDFHFINKYMPSSMEGKIIITNTVTAEDIDNLKNKGVKMVVTTTPELNGRSFGTNVMEGVLVVLAGKRPEELTESDYIDLLDRMQFSPRVVRFYN
jgi:hypothetical protein